MYDKQKTERHKLLSARGMSAKNGCEWDLNSCSHQPETYTGLNLQHSLNTGWV